MNVKWIYEILFSDFIPHDNAHPGFFDSAIDINMVSSSNDVFWKHNTKHLFLIRVYKAFCGSYLRVNNQCLIHYMAASEVASAIIKKEGCGSIDAESVRRNDNTACDPLMANIF